MRPVVLFRASLAEEAELEVCRKYFPVITQRSHVQSGDLVIPRYSALPWYEEFQADVEHVGGKLINTYREHCYVADLRNWYYDLGEYTPRTWFYLDQIPTEGPFVLKGQTSSKKHNWNTHMFARNKYEASEVHSRLCQDGYVGVQQIYVRQYVPLRNFLKGIQGLPISEEYRFFVLDGNVLSGAFYWSEHTEYIQDELGFTPSSDLVPRDFLNNVISIIASKVRFFVVDIARTEKGEWIVVELNDGSMSGLSDNSPYILYENMKRVLSGQTVKSYT